MEPVGTRTTSPSFSDSRGFGFLGTILIVLTLSAATLFVTVMLVPTVLNRQARESQLKGQALRAAIQAYQANHGRVPGVTPGTLPGALTALLTNDGVAPGPGCALDNTPASPTYLTLQGWCGPYVDQVIVENGDDYRTDGWGTVFQYNSGTGAVTSCGADRGCGNGDDLTF